MADISDDSRAAPGDALKWLRLAMVAAVVLPLSLFGATAAVDYVRVVNQATERVHKTASIAQEHALKVIETSELIISRVSDLIGDDDDAHIVARQQALHQKLKRIEHDIEQVQGIHAWRRDGSMQLSSRFYPAPFVDISGRDDFAVHVGRDVGLYISTPIVGRVSGDHFFNLSRRRLARDGRFDGVISVSLLPQYFTEFYRELSTSRGGLAVSLWRGDGTLLARYPGRGDAPVRLAPDSALAKFVESGRYSGASSGISGVDHKERLFGFRKIGEYPLYVTAGLDYSEIMSEWYLNLRTSALFAFPAALGLLLVTWIAMQKTRREQTAIGQWREEASRRASAEEALRQAQKLEAIGQLTGGVAHDFNNLLQVVSTNLYILRLKARGSDVEPQLTAIGRAVASGETLTKHLLGFSRRRPLQPVVMRLQDCMEEIRTLLKHTIRGNITLRCDIDPGLWPIYADAEELQMALLNVAVNARDAQPDGGSIVIEARNVTLDGSTPQVDLRGDYVAIAVRDSGHGIPPDILARVFEPFFTTKEVGKGTGLGLSQVYGFAMQSGGAATITSETGSGTTVTIYMPRAAEAPQPRMPPSQPGAHAAVSGRVLLAEDNMEVGAAVSAVLREMGYAVRHVPDAGEALAALRDCSAYDLLITDIVMPGGMSGLDLAREVRRRCSQLPVLLMSGYTGEADKAAAEGYRILSKPFRPETLADAIRRAVHTRDSAASDVRSDRVRRLNG